MSIKENIETVKNIIEESSRKAKTEEVVLVGISKTFPLHAVKEAIKCGLGDIGENRIQEAETKFPHIPNARKHFVGHLQGNKVGKAIELFDMIQSVDSLGLAGKISEKGLESRKAMPVLVQVRTDDKKQFGVPPEDLENFLHMVSHLKGIRIQGLMTIGPYFEKPEDSRPIFRQMRSLFVSIRGKNIPNVDMRYLSMGMSHDFGIAIEEGANMVRIGQAIFGRMGCSNPCR